MEQSDVFISYRRTDVEFVKEIVKALKDTNREVWLDWEDIPPGADGFTNDIQLGIQAANAFIAILSPAYLESEYCLTELREAVRLKKRIVPVVYQKFDPAPPPDGIREINWVYFTPHAGQENLFEQSFPKIIQALDADYEHARQHTRLLTRAIEWDKHQRENSYLLKGAEIDQAEGWQVKATSKDPPATELHIDYILNSRKQQRIQQRRITFSIGVLLALAVIAAVYAVFKANEARISAEIAHSNALASAALQPGNEDIAIALALEATRSEYAPESAYNTLARLAYPVGGIRHLMVTSEDLGNLISPAISPGGEFVVIKNQMFNMKTLELVQTFEPAPIYTLTGLFTADGKQIILAGDDDPSADPIFLGLYDVASGKLIRVFDTDIGISDVQLSADGMTLIAYQPNNKAVWWDVRTGKQKRVFEIGPSENFSLATFSPDLRWMAQARLTPDTDETELDIINTQNMEVRHTITGFDTAISILRFSNDSKEIAVKSGELETFSVETGKLLVLFPDAPIGIFSIRYSPDGTSIVTPSTDQTVILWDSLTGTVIKKQNAHHSRLIFADFASHGELVVSMDSSGVIITWDTQPGNLEKSLAVIQEHLAAITPDGRQLITEDFTNGLELNRLIIRDAHTLEKVSNLPVKTGSEIQSYYLAEGWEKGLVCYVNSTFSPEGLITSSSIDIANLQTGEIKQSWQMESSSVSQLGNIQFAPSGKELYVQYYDADYLDNLEVWDIATGKIVRSYFNQFDGSISFALDPTGSYLALSRDMINTDGTPGISTKLVDTSTDKTVATFNQPMASMFFTPDGSQLVLLTGDEFGEIKSHISVYSSKNGALLHHYIINADPSADFQVEPQLTSFITNIAGSGIGGGGITTPSGIYLSSDGIIQPSTKQWNFATGQLIWEFPLPASKTFFTPDSKHLLSSSFDTLRSWRLDSSEELVAWTCANRYVAEFTPEQRELFNIESNLSVCTGLKQ